MKHLAASEIVAGLCLSGKINPEHVPPQYMAVPYDRALAALVEGKGTSGVIDAIGVQPWQVAKLAGENVDPDQDWIDVLKLSASRELLAWKLEQEFKRLKNGKEPDAGKMLEAYSTYSSSHTNYRTLDEIDPEEGAWVASHYPPLDTYLGGIPEGGLTVIGAPPGVGKTSLLMRMLVNMAKAGEQTLFYSLEMLAKQIAWRITTAMEISTEERKRIMISDSFINVDQLYAEATRLATKYKFSAIGIDFADLLNEGEENDKKIGYIYRRCAELAKVTKIPVILLSPLSRSYVGGLPRIHHLRYSSMAEHMAALILLLYNPSTAFIDSGKQNPLTTIPGSGYIIAGKSRFGFKMGGIGAVCVGWDSSKGMWLNDASNWVPLDSI